MEMNLKGRKNVGRNVLIPRTQEAQRVPGRKNSMRNMLRHILIKLRKINNKKIFKATRERQQITCKELP